MKKVLYFISIIALFSSCAKDGKDGATGPAGNANVKAFEFNVTPGDWLTSGTAGNPDHAKYVELNVPALTPAIMESGLVLTYIDLSGYYVQLPTILPVNQTAYINFVTAYTEGIVEVDLQLSNLQTPNTNSANYTFKVIIADGVARLTHPEVNWKDLHQVEEVFNLD